MRLNAAIVVLLTSLVAATYGFGIYLFAQLVPDMQASLGFDFSYVGSITASAQLGFLLCALLAVWLTPKIGGGWMIVASGAVCALALLLISLTNNILVIGVLLTLLAGTAATVFVPMVDVITRVVAYRYRGLAMGLVSSGTSYGVAINSLLVPMYAAQGEWRSVWWWGGADYRGNGVVGTGGVQERRFAQPNRTGGINAPGDREGCAMHAPGAYKALGAADLVDELLDRLRDLSVPDLPLVVSAHRARF